MRGFEERVSGMNAVLQIQKVPPWVPPFEFRPFGADTYGALGKSAHAQANAQQLAK